LYPHRELRRPRVGLVLSGGGARGAAQIGVLRVLERHGIPVDFIAATSMGAIIGGLYASGYSVTEVESLALRTRWDEVLSLTEDTRRSELFVDQKLAGDRSFLAVRFQGFEPVIPSAVSTGQRLTDFLSTQALQAVYHPSPDFDHLKIPFRAVATDLVSGKRVVLSEGSFAEALRASATVPLLFHPIEKDSMQLVDGGLVANIPVDVARDVGVDIVLVVNSTSGLRLPEEMKAPWQTADQIMSIMMKVVNERQLENADVVITPKVGRHLSTNFVGLDSLIAAGVSAAEEAMPAILSLYAQKFARVQEMDDSAGTAFTGARVAFRGAAAPDSLRRHIEGDARVGVVSMRDIQEHVDLLYETGDYEDVSANVTADSTGDLVTFTLLSNPVLSSVRIRGARLISDSVLAVEFNGLRGRPLNTGSTELALERVVRLYRSYGYSLARIDSTGFDSPSGCLTISVNEGIVRGIDVQGGVRTRDSFVLDEFPVKVGEVFQVDKARSGVTNISSTTLFEYVYLEVTGDGANPVLTIRLKERPSQLVRFGIRADNERHQQGLIDIRDENFQGSGMELGVTVAGGDRNLDALLEYKARRLFDSYLSLSLGGFYRILDSYLYVDAPSAGSNRWERDRIGEYRDVRYGVSLSFGGQLERLGNATAELLLQEVRIRNIDHTEALVEKERLAMIRLGTIVDTKDRFPFPTRGVGLNLSYEFAFEGLGSDISYNALRVSYESYTTWGGRHTFHPRATMGFADKTMPFAQQFRLGGRDSFFGLREDDRRGRQLLLLNLEYRYFLPFRVLFDSYVRVRYDLGTISAVPEEIKFTTLSHGLGAEFALDTPVGQATFGFGKSFYFKSDLPGNPVQQGPFIFYFMIGYQL
jgi:NTE family protein